MAWSCYDHRMVVLWLRMDYNLHMPGSGRYQIKPMTKLQNWITTCKQLSTEELLIRCNAAAKAGMPEQFLEAACEVAESKGVSADQFVMALAANGGFVGGADAAVHS